MEREIQQNGQEEAFDSDRNRSTSRPASMQIDAMRHWARNGVRFLTARGLVSCGHVPMISNKSGELATAIIDWLSEIARRLLKPGVLGLGWSDRACSYKGAERWCGSPGRC